MIESGRVVHEGTAGEIRAEPALERAYLGEFGGGSEPRRGADGEPRRRPGLPAGSRSARGRAGTGHTALKTPTGEEHGHHLRNARVEDGTDRPLVDIGIEGGRIAAIEPGVRAGGEEIDAGGRLVTPGFVETHIHLDKSCILDRCRSERGDLEEAIGEVARVKQAFTPEDVYERGKKTLEKCILNGTTHMRTHLEVDPVIGLRGLEGVLPLVEEYKWAIDVEICIFPQEGLLNNPGTDELMVEALGKGGSVVGAAPYTDSDPHGQIDRIFEMAREFDIDNRHALDSDPTPRRWTSTTSAR